jgi:hypothetical protein
MLDESLPRFQVVWAAAGTPHDVFAVGTEALIQAIPGAPGHGRQLTVARDNPPTRGYWSACWSQRS